MLDLYEQCSLHMTRVHGELGRRRAAAEDLADPVVLVVLQAELGVRLRRRRGVAGARVDGVEGDGGLRRSRRRRCRRPADAPRRPPGDLRVGHGRPSSESRCSSAQAVKNARQRGGAKKRRPSVSGPNSGSTACSGCGIRPTTRAARVRRPRRCRGTSRSGCRRGSGRRPGPRPRAGPAWRRPRRSRPRRSSAGRRSPRPAAYSLVQAVDGALDPQPLVAADELAVVVAHQRARQQVRLAQHLEAVADARARAGPARRRSGGPASRTISVMIGENRAIAPQRR